MMFIRSSQRRPGVRFSPTRAKTLAHSAILSGITAPSVRWPEIAKCSKSGNFRDSTERPPGFIPSYGSLRGPNSLRRAPEESNRLARQSPRDLPERERDSPGMAKRDYMAAVIPFRSMLPRGGEGSFRNFDRAVASLIPEVARYPSFDSLYPSRRPLRSKREHRADLCARANHARSANPGAIEPQPDTCGARRRGAKPGKPATGLATGSGSGATMRPARPVTVAARPQSKPQRRSNMRPSRPSAGTTRLAANQCRSGARPHGAATSRCAGSIGWMVLSRSEPLGATSDGQPMLLRFGRGSAAR